MQGSASPRRRIGRAREQIPLEARAGRELKPAVGEKHLVQTAKGYSERRGESRDGLNLMSVNEGIIRRVLGPNLNIKDE